MTVNKIPSVKPCEDDDAARSAEIKELWEMLLDLSSSEVAEVLARTVHMRENRESGDPIMGAADFHRAHIARQEVQA